MFVVTKGGVWTNSAGDGWVGIWKIFLFGSCRGFPAFGVGGPVAGTGWQYVSAATGPLRRKWRAISMAYTAKAVDGRAKPGYPREGRGVRCRAFPVAPSCGMTNRLYYGDNLDVLRDSIADAWVDLVYLDPPFNSNAGYNVLFKAPAGQKSEAQIEAFEDSWHWTESAARAYEEVIRSPHTEAATMLRAMRSFLGENDMMAYLAMMAARLIELHRVLKETGSLYLHCDSTASHYLKIILDGIFGAENFRNEITWKRTTTHSDSKTWSRVSDVILFYTKGKNFTWNTPREAHSEEYKADKYRHNDGDGRLYQLDNMTSPNPRPNMMYEWKGFPFPQMGWRYSLETMAKLDSEGRIWYPTKPDGSFDASRRPRLKRYLSEMAGGNGMRMVRHLSSKLPSPGAPWLSDSKAPGLAGANSQRFQ